MARKVGSVRIELDHTGIAELLHSSVMAEECLAAGERIASMAGDGFEVRGPHNTGQRTAYTVYTATEDARIAESEDKALSMAVQACRIN